VSNGPKLSVPEAVLVEPSEPGAFTNNGAGTGAAVVASVAPDGTGYIVTTSSPAHHGGVLVIYCTGLGDVQTSIDAGDPAPLSPLANTMETVSVTIGGSQAQVLFSGLVPGFSGLYQINAIVPGGAPTGDSVPLAITVGAQASPTVTVAIK
jgi:uncharacterized protein (TIGR03437 family)